MKKTLQDLLLKIKDENPSLAGLIQDLLEKASIPLQLDITSFRVEDFSRLAELAVRELSEDERRNFYEAFMKGLSSLGSDLPKQLEEKILEKRLPPEKRVHSFEEVVYDVDLKSAVHEASRCLRCKTPRCVEACPLSFPVPSFLSLVAQEKFDLAMKLALRLMPSLRTCGRICVAYCEKACTLGQLSGKPVRIRAIKRAVADRYLKPENLPKPAEEKNIKVAVIGSGPAGLTAAYRLRLLGYPVEVFEAKSVIGGELIRRIPEFRLPSKIVEREVDLVKRLGVRFKTGICVGEDIDLNDLMKQGYAAIFIATGAGVSRSPGIPGLDLDGVEMALTFLEEVKFGKRRSIDGIVWVVGGGNVAVDAARTALRLGAKSVKIMYRRTRSEMPAFHEEVEEALREGVEIEFLTQPVEIIGEGGRVRRVKCIRMKLGEPGPDGRRRPIPIEGSEFEVEADHVIFAIGEEPESGWIKEEYDIELTNRKAIKIDSRFRTSRDGVFAGGDVVRGPSDYALAVADGIKAANEIDRYLKSRNL
ncbi:MAG: dihydropyrimidine dehydrogenase [Thaumarchaeota archaeon]|nr:MAG: dihydropyrimidine dehydrogenase [Nitrososphaerota archaeon]